MILCTLQEPVKSGIVYLCADGCAHLTFPWIALFLADYPEQRTTIKLTTSWCPRYAISLDHMPNIAPWSWHHNPQQYLPFSTTVAEEVSLWKFPNYSNFADAHVHYTVYRRMTVDRLPQLLQGSFNEHTCEWIVGNLKNILNQEIDWNVID